MQKMPVYRIGQGSDVHRTRPGGVLRLGGVEIEAPFGLDGHSDADVLLHAVIDALLGAAGKGDIGEWFPDTDARWKGADSAELLRHVLESAIGPVWDIQNLDCTISAEQPRLTQWKPRIRRRLAELLEVSESVINVKAKSAERVGPVGRGEAIAADASVLLCLRQPTNKTAEADGGPPS